MLIELKYKNIYKIIQNIRLVMTQIIYLVLHINYQKKNNNKQNNKNKKMQNFLTSITSIVDLNRGLKIIGLMNIQQNKKVFLKINS